MAITIEYGTPLASQLQDDVQRGLAEKGWSSGAADDTSLAEYIVINVLSNSDRDPNELTRELANDFVQRAPDDPELVNFVKGVFQRAESLSNGGGSQDAAMSQGHAAPNDAPAVQDMDMGDGDETAGDVSIPTGPKSMRNGKVRGDKRMLGQMNKAMDRSESTLHKIRGSAGTGRIDSHGAPRGPRGNLPKGPRGGMNKNFGGRQQRGSMGINDGMSAAFNNLTAQQKTAFIADLQAQANVNYMQSVQQQHGNGNPNSLFNRIGNGHSDAMELTAAIDSPLTAGGQNQNRRPPPSATMCTFNSTCLKTECPFVHSTPANPKGIAVDMSQDCEQAEGCTNFKCTGKHPSPAKAAQKECNFGPFCTNQSCRFVHPTVPACHNGADCPVEGCTFWHSKTECRHDPCTRPKCPYKHRDGQKDLARFQWVNPELKAQEHVSERKFNNADGQEELILPEKAAAAAAATEVE